MAGAEMTASSGADMPALMDVPLVLLCSKSASNAAHSSSSISCATVSPGALDDDDSIPGGGNVEVPTDDVDVIVVLTVAETKPASVEDSL
jgi:hypothetical protein